MLISTATPPPFSSKEAGEIGEGEAGPLRLAVRQSFRRLVAFAIDKAVLFAILALPQAIFKFTLGFSLFDLSGVSDPLGLEALVLLTISLPSWFYFIVSDASGPGASLGKRAMGL